MNHFSRDQRDHIGFRESDSFDRRTTGRFPGRNRFGEERLLPDSYHEREYNRWSDDIRSEASHENYFGKGPKGYKRSDDRIKEEACEILTEDFALDASDIEIEVKDQIIYLRGQVASRKDKKRAEYLLEDLSGVRDIQNLLTVKDAGMDGWIPGIGAVKETKGDQNGEA